MGVTDSNGRPPASSLRLIRWLCKKELAEEIEGNLHEFHHDLYASGRSFRSLKYWAQVFAYLRPSILKTFKRKKSSSMFTFNPRLAFRNLWRHRTAAFMHISGFTIGLIATIFLYFYISSEMNYDSFHEKGEEIYRVLRIGTMSDGSYKIGVTSGPYGEALQNDFAFGIKDMTRALSTDGLVGYGTKKFMEDRLLFADANFFGFFSFPLKVGDPASVLKQPNSVVISEKMAEKYFGGTDPVGQMLEVDNEFQFMVTGIMDEPPAGSHLEFDMAFSIEVFNRFDWFHNWWSNNLSTYVRIPDPAHRQEVEAGFPGFMEKYFAKDFNRTGATMRLTLEPLPEIYFNNDTRFDFVKHGNFKAVSILGLAALAILIIACFNYINLSISHAFNRAKEVGIRKVHGGAKGRLVLQFLGESLLILTLSVSFAIGLSELLLSSFNRFFGLEVVFNWTDPNVLIFFGALMALVLLASGLYPAMLLASFKPVSVLKGGRISIGRNLLVRKGLVVAQFAISIFIIAVTILISTQVHYMNSKELGFNKEAVIMVDLNNSEIRDNLKPFKDQLLLNASISEVTALSGEPGGFHDGTVIEVSGRDGNLRTRTVFADPDYLEVFDIEVVAGRGFSDAFETDAHAAMMINQKGLEALGLTAEEAIGRKVVVPFWDNIERTIIGITRDFHFASLKDPMEPLAIIMHDDHRRVAIRTKTGDLKQTLLFIDDTYRRFSPDFPMSYEFLDQSLAGLYENELKQARVFTAFSGISIFLACLGIFGLAAYSARRRQKELGIRKVLGAAPFQIIGLISREFLTLVVVAAGIAIPASWWFIADWLSEFAYRIQLADHWAVFVFSGVLAVLIALLTIGVKTWRAAVSNPTESIRYE